MPKDKRLYEEVIDGYLSLESNLTTSSCSPFIAYTV